MFHGPPLPLSPDVPLSSLLACAGPKEPLGAWVKCGPVPLQVYLLPHTSRCLVLASSDLGFLVGRCGRVAIREGDRTVVLPTETLIHWRALQVATATPYLPGLERLRALFPGLYAVQNYWSIPVHTRSPEEVLATCVAEGVRIAGSRVVYAGDGEGSYR